MGSSRLRSSVQTRLRSLGRFVCFAERGACDGRELAARLMKTMQIGKIDLIIIRTGSAHSLRSYLGKPFHVNRPTCIALQFVDPLDFLLSLVPSKFATTLNCSTWNSATELYTLDGPNQPSKILVSESSSSSTKSSGCDLDERQSRHTQQDSN